MRLVEYATSKQPDSKGRLLLREFNGYILPKEQASKYLTEVKREDINAQNGKLILAGVLQRAEAQNQNGRIYSKKILQKEVENYWDTIRRGNALGECDHPDRSIIEWEGVSHRVTDLWWEGNDLMGKIEILTHFPKAQYLVAAYKHGIPIGISSRGLGSVSETGGRIIVGEDFQLLCWDAVVDPSTHEAFLKLKISEAGKVEKMFEGILRRK